MDDDDEEEDDGVRSLSCDVVDDGIDDELGPKFFLFKIKIYRIKMN